MSVTRAYSAVAAQYLDLFASGRHEHPEDLALLDRHLAHTPGPVLDLGCGPGHLAARLRTTCADVTGIDLVPEFVAHARQAHPGVRFELGSLTATGRPDGSVAGALAWYSLVHVAPAELPAVAAEVRRILAPGAAFVTGFFQGPVREPFAHRVTTAHRWPAGEFAAVLTAAGFVEVERVQRGQDGDRRPHAALAFTAGPRRPA